MKPLGPSLEVSLEQRRRDYAIAAQEADRIAANYVEARAGGRMTATLEQAFDSVLREFRCAARKLDEAA